MVICNFQITFNVKKYATPYLLYVIRSILVEIYSFIFHKGLSINHVVISQIFKTPFSGLLSKTFKNCVHHDFWPDTPHPTLNDYVVHVRSLDLTVDASVYELLCFCLYEHRSWITFDFSIPEINRSMLTYSRKRLQPEQLSTNNLTERF